MISSTARDLPDHRQSVLDACLRQGMFPMMMKYLPAVDADAIQDSLDLVDKADIYLGIFAHRYGHVPKGYDISITEMEYNRAVERGIPRLIFIMHPDHPLKAADFDTGEKAAKVPPPSLGQASAGMTAFTDSNQYPGSGLIGRTLCRKRLTPVCSRDTTNRARGALLENGGRNMKPVRLSIGSWAYCFGPYQSNPVPFDTVIEKLGKLGFDGVELGGFPPHPSPTSHETAAKRAELKQKVADHGLQFSGLAADLWSCPIIPSDDNSKWMTTFESNLKFANDLGIDCIRVDAVSPPDIFEKENIDPKRGWERLLKTFRTGAQKAAGAGIRVVYEFEPGFAFNKPSEIMRLVDDVGHPNFRILFDTCHAHICAAVGARQPGEKETLAGGALELLTRLKGKIGHIHLIDSDGSLHHDETSTHAPFGQGVLDFDRLLPEVLHSGVPSNWWTIDLCFWPDAWEVTADAKVFLEGMARKYAGNTAS